MYNIENTPGAEPMFDPARIEQLQAEYIRTNPYDLPELRSKRSPRPRLVKGVSRELVRSARPW